MRKLIVALAVAGLLSAATTAWASRCGGYADTLIAWCDDFDTYCTANSGAEPPSTWPGYPPTPDNVCPTDGVSAVADESFFREHWPKIAGAGCDSMGPLTSKLSGGIAQSMPMVAHYQGFTNSSQYHEWDMSQAIADRHTGMNAVNGTDANPLQLRWYHRTGVAGAFPNSPAYLELRLGDGKAPTDWVQKDCMGGIGDCSCWNLHWYECDCYSQHATIPCNCENLHSGDPVCGTGESATCFGGPTPGATCTDYDPGNPTAPSLQCSSPCATGEETAATCHGGGNNGTACYDKGGSWEDRDYWCSAPCADEAETALSQCWEGAHNGELCYGDDANCEEVVSSYPIVNQQHQNSIITTPHPPRDTTVVYPALALGLLAQIDHDPCDLETGHKPTSYHVAVFDGNHWDDPRTAWYALPDPSGHGWSNYGDYNNLNEPIDGWLQMDVMTTSFHIQIEAVSGWSEGIVARQYTGPFNKIGMGTGLGCKLDGDPESPTYGQCLTEPACWDYTGGDSGKGWHNYYFDNVNLLDLDGAGEVPGGIYVSLIGACCLENGTCDDLSQADCETAGGRFQGISTACDDPDILCCPYPWADKEADGDVDQMDFGAFQVCYTGTGTGVPPGCECFDRDGDDMVDADDYAEFTKCWTGANVPYKDVHPAGGCTP